ncbi:tyrosine recombinase XerC [bacterium BMS3Bbin14]|nr:tyrosine recombinase XerC [bacterium BMS3Bbin14]
MDFQYYLKRERKNAGGSINRKIFTLRRYAQHLRLVDVPDAEVLPFQNVLKIRQGYRKRPLALTEKQIKRLFAAIDRATVLGLRDYAVYALMFLTGLRVGEVHQLDLESIDFEQKLLVVNGKGNKPRTLHLHEELFRILTEYLAVRPAFYQHAASPALFVSKKGNRLAIRTMEDNLMKIVAKADLGASFSVTCHTLRHTFASHLNDKEVDILVIQSLLGHATPRSTEAYIHPSREKIRQALEKLPAVAFLQNLIEQGVLNLRFQGARPQRE